MIINLNFLKFHHFNLSKKINNLSHKKYKEYFDNLFYKDDHCLVNVLKRVKNDCNSFALRNHIINGINKEKLLKVIINQHRNLYEDLAQYFQDFEKIIYWQAKLSKSERLIYVIGKKRTDDKEITNENNYDTNKKYDVFIPILFDLKHCFYQSKDKNYDNNFNKMNFQWNFRDQQKQIKDKILKLIC